MRTLALLVVVLVGCEGDRDPGQVRTIGAGCPRDGVTSALRTTRPLRGELLHVGLHWPGWFAHAPAVLVVGGSSTSWRGVPLPVDLGFLGSAGCALRVSCDVTIPFPTGADTVELPLHDRWPGVFFMQALVFDSVDATAPVLRVSNAVAVRVGG